MSHLERAIADGHAKFSGEGKQQAVPAPNGGQRDFPLSASTGVPRSRERELSLAHQTGEDGRRSGEGLIPCQVRVVGEKQFNAERAGVRCLSLQLDERKKPDTVIECKADGVTDAEFNQAVEQACGNGTVAQSSRRRVQEASRPDTLPGRELAAGRCRHPQARTPERSNTITKENGLHYADVEIEFDPEYHRMRDDFDPPYRMFVEPVFA